jgi:hypothetical protein
LPCSSDAQQSVVLQRSQAESFPKTVKEIFEITNLSRGPYLSPDESYMFAFIITKNNKDLLTSISNLTLLETSKSTNDSGFLQIEWTESMGKN